MNKKNGVILAAVLASILIAVVGYRTMFAPERQAGTEAGGKTSVKVGCLSPFEPMLQQVKECMQGKGYDFEVVLFDANNLPAVALKDGDLDGLFHNHLPWIKTFNKENESNLQMAEPYITYGRVALYSTKHKTLEEIPDNAQIAIPGDPSNIERSLLMLQGMGFVTLGEKTGAFYTLLDIESNPKNIQIIETEISQTARTLVDVDAAICYGQRVQQAGYDAGVFLYDDPAASSYPTGLVVRAEDIDQEWVAAFLDCTRTDEFKQWFNEYYAGTYLLFE